MDTWQGINTQPITLNKYLYGNADPAAHVDPTGNFSMGQLMTGLNIASNLVSAAQTTVQIFNIASGAEEFDAREVGTSVLLNMLPVGRVLKILNRTCRRNSFDVGTLVKTEKGLVSIENIRIGMKVYSFNEKTLGVEYQEVTHLISDENVKSFIDIKLSSGETITATEGHPFYVSGGWVTAGNLIVENKLLNASGNLLDIVSINKYEKVSKVYNITVSNTHTYFVGENELLNHNSNCFRVNSRISESPRLSREAQTAGRSQVIQRDLDDMTAKLAEGNLNPGIGTKPIGKGFSEARSRNGARVYFRVIEGEIQILGKSSKDNQQKVIKEILDVF